MDGVTMAILAFAVTAILAMTACTAPSSESGMKQVFRAEVPISGSMMFEAQ